MKYTVARKPARKIVSTVMRFNNRFFSVSP